jgi:hypothetical protein
MSQMLRSVLIFCISLLNDSFSTGRRVLPKSSRGFFIVLTVLRISLNWQAALCLL